KIVFTFFSSLFACHNIYPFSDWLSTVVTVNPCFSQYSASHFTKSVTNSLSVCSGLKNGYLFLGFLVTETVVESLFVKKCCLLDWSLLVFVHLFGITIFPYGNKVKVV